MSWIPIYQAVRLARHNRDRNPQHRLNYTQSAADIDMAKQMDAS
jgi:hypothetical protein